MEQLLDIISFVIIAVWALALIQSTRMFHIFRKKHPETAKNKISNAFKPYADPDKLFFFFKKENRFDLQKDKEIWRLRQQTKILLILSIGIPFLAVSLFIFAFMNQ